MIARTRIIRERGRKWSKIQRNILHVSKVSLNGSLYYIIINSKTALVSVEFVTSNIKNAGYHLH